MDNDSTVTAFGQTTPNLADKAADQAHDAIRSTQNVANDALDQLSDGVDDARATVAPALDRLSRQAEELARRSLDSVRESSALLRQKATELSDATAVQIREEPIKAMLIAAATGAALMGLVTLVTRSSNAR